MQYTRRAQVKRAEYLARLRGFFKSHGKENIVYFDESGFKKHSYRPHGWALRGQKLYGDISGNNRKDVNLIMAQRRDQWLAPVVFKGTCNTDLVNTWLRDFLLKELERPSVIVMDNARFHKKSDIKDILERAGHVMLPLPTYSPDFNPIEKSFALLKKRRQYSGKTVSQLLKITYCRLGAGQSVYINI